MKILWLFLATVAGTTSLPVHADHGDDTRRVRELVEAGRILPLERLLAMHGERLKGRLLDLELESEDGGYVYELELVGSDGVVREIEIDAASGEILDEEREH